MDSTQFFTKETFDLLQLLHLENSIDTYLTNSELFRSTVQDPFQDLFSAIARKLPKQMLDIFCTDKDIFCRTSESELGVLDFYWGAFTSSIESYQVQLFVFINYEMLEFGLYMGTSGAFYRQKRRRSFSSIEICNPPKNTSFLSLWLQEPNNNTSFTTVLPKDEVLQLSNTELINSITSSFKKLCMYAFPYMNFQSQHKKYGQKQCAQETHISQKRISSWLSAIRYKKQAIIYGPPGTGKTYLAERLAQVLLSGGRGVYTSTQFHNSYSYEDFIQGIRPQDDGIFRLQDGVFVNFCNEARQSADISVLLIDEINRAAMDRVFGELMYLLEYRNREVKLLSGQMFSIPEQVYIIGTMNTADKSIATIDYALRRRFILIPLYPDYDIMRKFKYEPGVNIEELIIILRNLNDEIANVNFQIGTSFFLISDLKHHIKNIWLFQIEPYVEEYFFNELHRVEQYRWNKIYKKVLEHLEREIE